MHNILFLAAAAAAPQPSAITERAADQEVVVTASREPVAAEATATSATVIDREQIEALALPATSDVLRLVPGVSVSLSGPRGTQTQLRIRGGEANHTLLFLDGIRFNDPAAGNEARFELLTSDPLSRIEVVRGPKSALWGSEALGGVIAAETANPLTIDGLSALAEYGSLDTVRASGQFATKTGALGLSGSAGLFRTDGIDSFGSGGERDGYENRSASLKAVFSPLPAFGLGLVGHYVEAESDFDGYDPSTFRRADTLDATDNRIFALRAWSAGVVGGWSIGMDGSYLDSSNRNRLGTDPLNSTFGERFTVGGQVSRSFGGHRVTAALEHEDEAFRARDQIFFGGTNQNRSRNLTAVVGEWRAEWSPLLITGFAVRHDEFSAFDDATTIRATALLRPARRWSLHASYGEGIAQPTFYDLFGFFPGSFEGNPDLRPERSKGYEAGVEWANGVTKLGVTAFSNRLRDEIVDVFDPTTFLSTTANAAGTSRRRGFELVAASRIRGIDLSANYTYLDAEERQSADVRLVREVRRPRHSANLLAAGSVGPLNIGGSLSYVGKRQDRDFDQFPAPTLTLGDYVLASLKVGWQVSRGFEAYVRAENLFDADYQDVIGFNTPGRTIYAGLRVRLGD